MAGSQLKQLKAALKENGLTGQTNVKRKTNKKAPFDSRRDDTQEKINKIREQFNPFDKKINKSKTDTGDRFVKGSQGKPGASKSLAENQRRAAYEAKKSNKNRNGFFNDSRFGENDKTMTPEEKMLARFTREKQMQSSRSGMFNLDDESDDELTHYGKSLALNDDFEQDDDDLQNSDDDDDFLKPKKRSREIDNVDDELSQEDVVPKKKTKAEVMKEVIAKSKFYKEKRQQAQEEREGKIDELDEEFTDVLQELGSIPKQKQLIFESKPKDPNAINYEQSVRELNLDRRAAPADRTKTEEELNKEWEAKQKELEEARLRRMQGEDYGAERGPDELDDDFWGQGSEDEAEGFQIDEEEGEEENDDDESQEATDEQSGKKFASSKSKLSCPNSIEDLHQQLEKIPFEETPKHINKIIELYSPRLQAGNKEKLSIFTTVILQHILYLSESDELESESFSKVQESLVSILKKLSEKHSIALTEFMREKIIEIQERITTTITGEDEYPLISDLTFFSLVGVLFSTSDHYHLIVTPSLIVLGETLEQLKYDSLNLLIAGSFVSQIILHYQRISKRFVPEVAYFLQKALLSFAPKEIKDSSIGASPDTRITLSKKIKTPKEDVILRISDIERDLPDSYNVNVFFKLLSIIDLALESWKEKTAFVEISTPFKLILSKFNEFYPDSKPITSLFEKFQKLNKFAKDERKPLTLQSHKKLAIATYAPKYEENFNPEKKSYDHDRQRQDINKMRAQIKQERKTNMREMRKDARFEARQQISEKKDEYKKYHAKMASILNTVSTSEGAEKNAYDREKKARKGKK
ncbi:Nucleolar protein 14 [Wickerhamomyces ciferrii]|uniref:Nucleolar protein 14 n=1 Tax=Wickerhamomyces ciferrii (strain ATCC 14091 / BCRC 22168 / CBS 111 / JCM 3599 / NBRC 0793 / NRRL Y-1031 F-60-10) TaxID=1206466 RepID=K0KNK7_WICCF|nr:Nucleolar protein 14 [Wickerhamomyces ciferrii]CCH44576.1 Nucleolar protein 14 [Wickerhamomyces ciferrii]